FGLAAVSQVLRQLRMVFDRAAAGVRDRHKGVAPGLFR
ncbi:MAG: hypothetical protein ACI80I_003531, partial [Akkermansiaceae bacterium]